MRLIYVDEAGTSASEPVLVVAAVIVEPDIQLQAIQNDLTRLISEHVPEHLRADFYIHATDIFSGSKRIKRGEWAFEDRLKFLKALLAIPLANDAPITVSYEFKEQCSNRVNLDHLDIPAARLTKFRGRLAHFTNFNGVTERSDYFLREYLKGREKGVVVAEDHTEMRKVLTEGGLLHRSVDRKLMLDAGVLRRTESEERLGVQPSAVEFRIDHIIDVPHFVQKQHAPMLQLADLCAFTFRRFLSGGSHGADLLSAMLGPIKGPEFIRDPVWREGHNIGIFGVEPYRDAQQIEADKISKLMLMAANIHNPFGAFVLTSGTD